MSVQDATAALNEDTGIFAFLPVANFVYLFTHDSSLLIFTVAMLATLISAAVYNLLTGEPDAPSQAILWALRVVGLSWLLLLIVSVGLLITYLNKGWVIPEVLFFVSLLFLALMLTDVAARYFLDGYESTL